MKTRKVGRPPKATTPPDLVQGLHRGVQREIAGHEASADPFEVGRNVGHVTHRELVESGLKVPVNFTAVGVSGIVVGTFESVDQLPRITKADDQIVSPVHVALVDPRGVGMMIELTNGQTGNAPADHAELVTAGGA